jgi:hypothetical protein
MYPGVSGRLGDSEDPLNVIEVSLDRELIGGGPRERRGLNVGVDSSELFGIIVPFALDWDDVSALDGQRVTLRQRLREVLYGQRVRHGVRRVHRDGSGAARCSGAACSAELSACSGG